MRDYIFKPLAGRQFPRIATKRRPLFAQILRFSIYGLQLVRNLGDRMRKPAIVNDTDAWQH